MTKVTINDPIRWHEKCDWIEANCKNYKDITCWAAWQIGYDDIYFLLEDGDAVWFTLVWS